MLSTSSVHQKNIRSGHKVQEGVGHRFCALKKGWDKKNHAIHWAIPENVHTQPRMASMF